MTERERVVNCAESVERFGCGFCEDLKWKGRTPYCDYCKEACEVNSDEIEWLFECDKVSKAMFGSYTSNRPKAFPVQGCKYKQEARKLFQEFIKEGQNDGL